MKSKPPLNKMLLVKGGNAIYACKFISAERYETRFICWDDGSWEKGDENKKFGEPQFWEPMSGILRILEDNNGT